MKQKRDEKTGSVRVSVTFAAKPYTGLERVARKKKVSIAWVVRDAVDKYLNEDVPLFEKSGVTV